MPCENEDINLCECILPKTENIINMKGGASVKVYIFIPIFARAKRKEWELK